MRVIFESNQPSRTKQSFGDEADINKIMERYNSTGIMPAVKQGFYADVSDVGDFREAVERVRTVEGMFGSLPSIVRARFQNDPASFLEFVEDADDDELEEIGLAIDRGENDDGQDTPSGGAEGAPEDVASDDAVEEPQGDAAK